MYDVVISGAGPAGAMAGQVLAKAGYKIIIYVNCPPNDDLFIHQLMVYLQFQ
ncbi:MAG: FAD-dependent monooxygenase [Candidatus Helarchaeota archaeon]|nr:FAD-dependent monooxygenase [Candidatus Helarchaeota archaeon]